MLIPLSGLAVVKVEQAAEALLTNDLTFSALRLCSSPVRERDGIIDSLVTTLVLMECDVVFDSALQRSSSNGNEMIEAFFFDAAHKSLSKTFCQA